MKKISKYELLHFFMHLCKDMGKKVCLGESNIKDMNKWIKKNWCIEWKPPCEIAPYKTVGAWRLDYVGCYGGWQIQEVCSGGGIDCPLGYKRHKSSELMLMINFGRELIRLNKQRSEL